MVGRRSTRRGRELRRQSRYGRDRATIDLPALFLTLPPLLLVMVSILTQPEGWVLRDQVVGLAQGIGGLGNHHIFTSPFQSERQKYSESSFLSIETREKFMERPSLTVRE